MKRVLLAFGSFMVLTGVLALGTSAQTPDQPAPEKPTPEKAQTAEQQPGDPCPKIELKAPNQPVRDGMPVKISVALAGGDKKVSPMFDWSISAGMINAGQGTPTIEVDTSGAGSDRTIYATVLLGGFAPECESSANATVTVAAPARKVDEFGTLPEEELTGRLDKFLSHVSPSDQAYIFAYAGRTNVRGYASSSLRQIRAHALKAGISSDRLVTMDGGFREDAVYELWLVPIGSEAPRPSPTVSARDIVFPKPPAPVRKRP
jgi:hypothetical protein